jgi:hypothetical protein
MNTIKKTNKELQKSFGGKLQIDRQADGDYLLFTGYAASYMSETILNGSNKISAYTPAEIIKIAKTRLKNQVIGF